MNELMHDILADRYQILEKIGTGGMALVYKGQDKILERQVAIKVLKEQFSKYEQFQMRFREEAKAAANLNHQHIVTIFDYGIDQNAPYIVMEYVPGVDLNSMIKKHHNNNSSLLTFRQGINLIIQASKGLGYAHKAGIVHCDVKPHNFLITSQNVLKITDFGIAQAFSSFSKKNNNEMVWGSPIYLSPEQAAGEPITPASDIYSLGIIMYYLFTGQYPFVADTPEKLSYKHQYEKPTDSREINPQIPVKLNAIIMKLLDKDPVQRFRSADHLAHILIDLFENQKTTSTKYLPIKKTSSTNYTDTIPTKNQKIIPLAEKKEIYNQPTLNIKNVLLTFLAAILVGGIFPLWLWILLIL